MAGPPPKKKRYGITEEDDGQGGGTSSYVPPPPGAPFSNPESSKSDFYSPDPNNPAPEDVGIMESAINRVPAPNAMAGARYGADAGFVDPIAQANTSQQALASRSRRFQGTRNVLPGYGWALNGDSFRGGIGDHPMVAQSARVGNYGGDPLFLPNDTRLAFDVVASKVQGIAQQQQRLDQEKKALEGKFDPWASLKDTPHGNQYRQYFQDTVPKELNSALSDIVNSEAFGGDAGKAYAALSNPAVAQQMGWTDKVRDIQTVVDNHNNVYDKAVDYVTKVNAGDALENPLLTQAANDILDDQVGDFHKTAKNINLFNAAVSLDKYAKDKQILDKIQARIQAVDPTVTKGSNGLIMVQAGTMKDYEPFIQEESQRLANSLYRGQLTQDQISDYFRAHLQEQAKPTLQVFQPRASKGGGSGSGGKAGYTTNYQYGPIQVTNDEAGTSRLRSYDQLVLADVTNGKGQFPRGRSFTAEAGTDVFMHPVAIARDGNGSVFIYGKVAKAPGTVTVKDDPKTGSVLYSITNPKTGKTREMTETEYFSSLQDKMIRYDKNEGAVTAAFPGLTKEVIMRKLDEGKAARGGGSAPAKAASVPSGAPAVGTVDGGYRFKGGDPNDAKNWELVK